MYTLIHLDRRAQTHQAIPSDNNSKPFTLPKCPMVSRADKNCYQSRHPSRDTETVCGGRGLQGLLWDRGEPMLALQGDPWATRAGSDSQPEQLGEAWSTGPQASDLGKLLNHSDLLQGIFRTELFSLLVFKSPITKKFKVFTFCNKSKKMQLSTVTQCSIHIKPIKGRFIDS